MVSYCEDQGWLRVDASGSVGATDEGCAWLDECDRELGYDLEWTGADGEAHQTTNRILVHAAYKLAAEAPGEYFEDSRIDTTAFTTALDTLVPSHAVR